MSAVENAWKDRILRLTNPNPVPSYDRTWVWGLIRPT